MRLRIRSPRHRARTPRAIAAAAGAAFGCANDPPSDVVLVHGRVMDSVFGVDLLLPVAIRSDGNDTRVTGALPGRAMTSGRAR